MRTSAFGRTVLVGAVTALLCSCATRGGNIPYGVTGFDAPDLPTPEEAAYDWPLGPMDVLRVSVFQVPELSGEFRIDARGFIDLPLVGPISVRDRRPAELAAELERLYGQRYLHNPDVTVRLMQTDNRNITVEGGVRQPRVAALPGKTNLLSAIAIAGGIDPEGGNARRVAIFRKREGRTVAAAFDLISIRRGEMENPVVYPGDTIVVDSNQLRGIYRDILQTIPVIALFNPL